MDTSFLGQIKRRSKFADLSKTLVPVVLVNFEFPTVHIQPSITTIKYYTNYFYHQKSLCLKTSQHTQLDSYTPFTPKINQSHKINSNPLHQVRTQLINQNEKKIHCVARVCYFLILVITVYAICLKIRISLRSWGGCMWVKAT